MHMFGPQLAVILLKKITECDAIEADCKDIALIAVKFSHCTANSYASVLVQI